LGGFAHKQKPRGKGFQSGSDERRKPRSVGDSDPILTLPSIKQAISNAFNREQGGINAVEAMIWGQVNSAIKGNTRAFEVLMQLGYSKELNDAMNGRDSNQQGTATIGLFNAPEHKTDFITDVEEI
jgi:hypothetical protein